ncbi:MAG: DUF5337 domain-containing protein [Pseudomonadota bacterium]
MAQKPTSRKPTERDIARAKTSRNVAVVLVATMALWLAAQWIGPQVGLAGNYAILFDLMALAGFIWALVVTLRLWRTR